MDHPTPAPAEVYDVDTDGGLPPGSTGAVEALAAIVTVPPVDLDEEDVAMIRAVAIDRAAERQVLAAADAFCARPTLERMRWLRAAVRAWRRARIDHDAWPTGPIPYTLTGTEASAHRTPADLRRYPAPHCTVGSGASHRAHAYWIDGETTERCPGWDDPRDHDTESGGQGVASDERA